MRVEPCKHSIWALCSFAPWMWLLIALLLFYHVCCHAMCNDQILWSFSDPQQNVLRIMHLCVISTSFVMHWIISTKAYTKITWSYSLKGSHLDAYIFVRLLLKCKHRIKKKKSCGKLLDGCEYASGLWGSTSLGYSVALWMHIPLASHVHPAGGQESILFF